VRLATVEVVMTRNRFRLSIVLAILIASTVAHSQAPPPEGADAAALNRIWQEGTNNSRVMEHLSWLTDVFGPRIPASPAYNKAAAWAVRRFTEIGLAGAVVEPAGEIGLGWSYEYVSAHMIAPSYMPILAYPRPWTGSTRGKITGSPVLALISTKADLDKYKGKLKDAIVFLKEPRPIRPNFNAPARRLDDKNIQGLEDTPIPVRPARPGEPTSAVGLKWEEMEEFFRAEGVGVLVEPSSGSRSDFGTVKVDAYGGNGTDYITRGQSPRIIGLLNSTIDLPDARPQGPGDPGGRGPDDDL
jgi:hypothetical protein